MESPRSVVTNSGKQRRAVAEQLTAIPDGEERVLLATGRYVGEGFDDARLDTLFLALPISCRGTLQQYVGRLHRLHDSKREVIVYDYVDGCVPVFSAMYSTREEFYALCENRHPQTGERLTLRQNAKDERRVFFDFTCSPPKSVSVLAVTLDDQRLAEAHELSAQIALRELETFAATRVRKQGGQRDRTTGNLVAAAFVHTSSRALDPQLHTHFTVFNGTFDEREQCWKALQAGAMYESIR